MAHKGAAAWILLQFGLEERNIEAILKNSNPLLMFECGEIDRLFKDTPGRTEALRHYLAVQLNASNLFNAQFGRNKSRDHAAINVLCSQFDGNQHTHRVILEELALYVDQEIQEFRGAVMNAAAAIQRRMHMENDDKMDMLMNILTQENLKKYGLEDIKVSSFYMHRYLMPCRLTENQKEKLLKLLQGEKDKFLILLNLCPNEEQPDIRNYLACLSGAFYDQDYNCDTVDEEICALLLKMQFEAVA